MEQLYSQLMMLYSKIFMVIWLGGIFFVVFLQTTKRLDDKLKEILVIIFITIIAFFILSAGYISQRYHNIMLNKFYALKNVPDHEMDLRTKNKMIKIYNPLEISDFITMINNAPQVSAHHSFPIDKIDITFPAKGYELSLGKDSNVHNEYWLEFDNYPGWGKAYKAQVNIKQFHSQEMSQWLSQKGVK